MAQEQVTKARYVQLPELIELFKGAPAFVSKKAFKAIPLAENGELMVETQITEHMAAGLATIAQEVQAGEYALIHTDYADKALPYLKEDGTITPDDLLNNHIEVMDVCDGQLLQEDAILDGPLGAFDTNVYADPLLQALIALEDMNIPSFMDPYGVERIYKGQILVRNSVLGVFPYQRPHHSLTSDASFLDNHLPVDTENRKLITLEESASHMAVASAVQSIRKSRPQADMVTA